VSRAGRLVLSPDERAAVERLFEAGSASAGDLGLETARRLLLAGIAVPA
jgi:hypothetical protein